MFLELLETEQANEVWESLQNVTDPELDEPVTDMGFIERISVDQQLNTVEVDFRLPTYWCSPNFAFLMGDDIRQAILRLSWVTGVKVTLQDHCFADRVNDGVNGNHAFAEVFADCCNGENLNAVRLKFMEKAFIRRQETVLLGLQSKGYARPDIVNMTLKDFDAVVFHDGEEVRQKPRYRSLLVSRGLATHPGDPAFVTWDAERLTVEGLRDYLARLRGVRINMEFNGALCRGLQSTRYKEVEIGVDGPTLMDFIQNRVPSDRPAANPE